MCGPSTSPLEVTSGRFSVAKSKERLRLAWAGREGLLTRSFCRRLRSTHPSARAAVQGFDYWRGAAPLFCCNNGMRAAPAVCGWVGGLEVWNHCVSLVLLGPAWG